jgi:hypothetical protein
MRRRHLTLPSPYETGQWGVPGAPCPSARTLAARLDGELDADRAAAVDAHLKSCPVCESDFRSQESLAGCLKAWDAKGQGLIPPDRIAARILRDVAAEASVRRHRRASEGRRTWAAAAAVLLVLGGAALLGRATARLPAPEETTASSALRRGAPGGGDPVRFAPPAVAALPPLRVGEMRPVVPTDLRLAAPRPFDGAVLADREAREAFARFAAMKRAEDSLGETPWWHEGRAFASSVLGEVDRDLRYRARKAAYERRVNETRTVVKSDDARVYLPFSGAFPLPPGAGPDGVETPFRDAAAFVEALYRVEVALPRGAAGLVVRVVAGGGAPAEGTVAALDLAQAVERRALTLVDQGRADSLVVDVRSEAPVFVPAGELIAGGLVDRVVARGAWLPAGTYHERLACRPVARTRPLPDGKPTPVGAVAGPALRGLLAADATTEEIGAFVDAVLAGAGQDPYARGASLVDLHATSLLAEEARVRAARVPFSGGDRGFLASDGDGRFLGIEVAGGDAGVPGDAALRRSLAGYLVEAVALAGRVRGGALPVDMAVFDLVRKAPPLVAPETRPLRARSLLGEEPVTGIALEAVPTESGSVAWASAVLPGAR